MRKRTLSVLCGVLLVLCLGHVSAFAAGSDNSQEASDAQISETAENGQSKDGDGVGDSTADEATDAEKDTSSSAETSNTTPAVPSSTLSTPAPSDVEAAEGDAQLAGLVNYRAHVQSIGWQDWAKDGALSGTTGRALRVEALQVQLGNGLAGSIEYCAHVQNKGWQAWTHDGAIAGTTGQSLRVEALRIRLSGDVAKR